MNTIKKYAGIIWIIAGPVAIYFLMKTALSEIAKNPVIGTKVQWIVFITIFTPIAIGLMLFGWYALKNEYQQLPESSAEIKD
jgi:purine-cytosine permease-like protein